MIEDNGKRKLVRNKLAQRIREKGDTVYVIKDKLQRNKLFMLKVLEEVREIEASNFEDDREFADLLQVVKDWIDDNGMNESVKDLRFNKMLDLGTYEGDAVQPDPNNPSNAIYYEK
jgi:hypothetical protein